MLRGAVLVASVTLFMGALASPPGDGQPVHDRDAVIRVLESMITKDVPADVDHGKYYWVQGAVATSIAEGDADVERLARRAARPLRGMISNPVSSTASPPHLIVSTPTVLHLRKTTSYTGTLHGSLDGGELVHLGTYDGRYAAISLQKFLGAAAVRPGGHHLRVRAHLRFTAGGASWTETRDLPELFYVVYDASHDASYGPALVSGPAAFTAADFDPLLPPTRLGTWLNEVLAPHQQPDRHDVLWNSRHCAARIGDPVQLLDHRGVCAVLVSETATHQNVQLWFRTADVELHDDQVVWVPLQVPRFEGIIFGNRNADRLSALNDLLQPAPGTRAGGDVAILPKEIVVSRSRSGVDAEISITVRNRGTDHVFGAHVWLEYGSDDRNPFGNQRFAVHLPPSSSQVLRARASLSGPYTWVLAQVIQGSEHGPSEGVGDDPTPGDACALVVLNAKAAPADRHLIFQERRKMQCQVVMR